MSALPSLESASEVPSQLAAVDLGSNSFHLIVAQVTHELRAPLAAIGSYLKVLLEGIGGTLTPQQKDMLRRAGGRCTGRQSHRWDP